MKYITKLNIILCMNKYMLNTFTKGMITMKYPFIPNFANPKKYVTISSIIYKQIPKFNKLYNSLKIWYGRFNNGSWKDIQGSLYAKNHALWPHYWNTDITIKNRSNKFNIPLSVSSDDVKGRSPLTRGPQSKPHQKATKNFL